MPGSGMSRVEMEADDVGEVLDQMGPDYRKEFEDGKVIVLVNGEPVQKMETPLNPNDEISLMRPMAGGAGVDVRQEESPITTTGPPEGTQSLSPSHIPIPPQFNLPLLPVPLISSPLILSKNQFVESVEIKDLSTHGGEWVG